MFSNKLKERVVYIYLFLYLLIISLICESQALANYGVIVPFIKQNNLYFLFVMLVVGFIFVMMCGKLKFDIFSIILFFRIVLCIIPLTYIDIPSSYFGNLIVSCFPFLIYMFFSNSRFKIKNIVHILIFFGIFISLQCFYAFYLIKTKGYANYNDEFYKNYFVIPIGATNNISAFLIPLLIIGDSVISKKFYKYLYCIIVAVAIILTKSRTGFVLLGVFYIYKIIKFLFYDNKKNKVYLLFIIPVLLLVGFFSFRNFDLISKIKNFVNIYSNSSFNLDFVLSGRITLFRDVLKNVFQYPIFGNGVTYEKLNYLRTHNFILQFLYENGLFGLVLGLVFLISAIKLMSEKRKFDPYVSSFFIASIFILMNGMVEEILLNYEILIICIPFLAYLKKETKISEVSYV